MTPCFSGLGYALHTEIRSITNWNEGISSQRFALAAGDTGSGGVDSVEGT